MTRAPRISLVHATPLAISPIIESFARWWPDAAVYNLLDDSLAADLQAVGGNIDAMAPRFSALRSHSAEAKGSGKPRA